MQAAGTSLEELTLDASGTLVDSAMWGTHVPEMSFKANIAESALTLDVKGGFDQLNPAVVLERKALDGNVNGTVDANLRWRDLAAPVTATAIDVDGRVGLTPSLVGGVQVAGADLEGKYAAEIADITRVHIDGPDVTLDASGRLALGRAGTSELQISHQRQRCHARSAALPARRDSRARSPSTARSRATPRRSRRPAR